VSEPVASPAAPVTSVRMDETCAATAATLPAARRRAAWLVPGGLLLLLALLTANVLVHGPLVAVDERIRDAMQAQANSATWHWLGHGRYSPAQLLVDLGNNQVALPVLAVCALVAAAWHRSPRPLIAAVTGVVLLLGIVVPAKILITRAGPGLPPVPHGSMGVFPSGHTSTSSVCLGLAALLLAGGLPGTARRAVTATMATLCFLVGTALIWCDYHWFTDVLAGWALSALIVMTALRITGLSGNSHGPVAAAGRGTVSVSSQQTAGSRPDD
jgi:membrane-associated phospholipid phosphatase